MWSMVASAAISGIIGILIWIAVRRPIDVATRRHEQLEDEVRDLREQRVGRLEKEMEKETTGSMNDRRDMDDKVARVRQEFVHKKECSEAMGLMRDQLASFNGSVLKLERVSERTDQALESTKELMQQVISTKEDLAHLVGRVESMNGKH